MPRKVSFDSEAVWYVPDIDDNREDSDPFCVLIEPMSAREYRACESAWQRSLAKQMLKKKGGLSSDPSVDLMKRIITDRVKQVRGYLVDEARGIPTPETGADLFDAIMGGPPSEIAILDDIHEAIKDLSKLSDGALGKLAGRSVSSTAEIQASSGDAQSAKGIQTETTSGSPATAMGTLTPTSTSNLTPVYADARGA